MRIGIDGFSLTRNDSGIEVYTRELVNGLLRSDEVEVYGYSDVNISVHDHLTVTNSRLVRPSTLRKLQWQLFDVAKFVSLDVDVYHCPHFILPLAKIRSRKIVTVHDLAFLKHPQFFDWKTKLYYKLFLKNSLSVADAIICISKSCQDDLHAYFPDVAAKSVLIHNGFKDFSRIPPSTSILKRLDISNRFLLLIGTLNPRKNIEGAIRAFDKISATHDLDLVVVGDLRQTQLHRANLNNRIHFTGYISDLELSALYRNASLLLFPSYYEGFGFPILEAMSVGLPVVTSNVSSMPEVSGYPSDYLCDPTNDDSIATLIERMLRERDSLSSHGEKMIKNFSWNKMVQLTRQIYATV
jgi:glycosyltransferase involved in cell wall biosynthesis